MNLDKGNLATGGTHAIVLGNFAKRSGDTSSVYEAKVLDNEGEPFAVTANSDGKVWLLFGTDSGFEGRTRIYFLRVAAEFTPL